MNFEIGHLDMLESPPSGRVLTLNSATTSQSLILNELQKDTEELQDKLKLNNRRLLLFETENNKLIEEKNKFFFELQNSNEKFILLSEKESFLESENKDLRNTHAILSEKNQALKQINQSQLLDLKRFTKFHLKIQNVIKPYINQLKTTVLNLKNELQISNKLNEELQMSLKYSQQSHQSESFQLKSKIASLETDKIQTIANYEEQIHSFSKEIIHLEQQVDDLNQESSRLKKSVEFKNYFENELIKFKRIHQDDQKEISTLKEHLTSLNLSATDAKQKAQESFEKNQSIESELMNKERLLEATRLQLVKTIDHSELLTERLNRLEKLNLNLSQQMQPTT
ncbi:MAG: hypothetical protein WA160_03750 [Pseudobdellovibrio sp.]